MSLKALLIPVLNQPPKRALLADVAAGDAVPKIIHQTFYERSLPPQLQANVDRLRTSNPGWEYRFYDDADVARFIQENYPPLVWQYFQRLDARYGAARADLFRYLLLYKVGGVYLDIKSSATRPLDSVLRPDDRFLLSQWLHRSEEQQAWGGHDEIRGLPGGEYQQWHIVCAPGHPFLKAVIETVLSNMDRYDPHLHETGKRGVLRVTGPIPYTLAIHRIQAAHPHRVVDSRDDLGFEYNLYPNQSHQTAFKSHYSLQTAPLVKMGFRKRQLSHLYGLAQYLHDQLRGRRDSANAA
jgi:mannosyltransferase OCH1-like enzyme